MLLIASIEAKTTLGAIQTSALDNQMNQYDLTVFSVCSQVLQGNRDNKAKFTLNAFRRFSPLPDIPSKTISLVQKMSHVTLIF